jgi:hypothetical protein
MTNPSRTRRRALAAPLTVSLLATLLAAACGAVEPEADHDHDDRYLQLTSINAQQAAVLTTGSNADALHTHANLPLSAMSVEQAKALTGGGNADALHTHAAASHAWAECGTILDLIGCEVPDRSPLAYEYGIAYNSAEPAVIKCTTWNKGIRVYNREPYFINADNPATMGWGGFVFYKGTLATDDDDTECGTAWRHHYWLLTTNNVVNTIAGNACYGDTTGKAPNGEPLTALKIYCRLR